jgi:hypothetical protein
LNDNFAVLNVIEKTKKNVLRPAFLFVLVIIDLEMYSTWYLTGILPTTKPAISGSGDKIVKRIH